MPDAKTMLERARASALRSVRHAAPDALGSFVRYRERRRRNRRLAAGGLALLLVVAGIGAALTIAQAPNRTTIGGSLEVPVGDGPCFPNDDCWDLDVYVMRTDGTGLTRIGGGPTRDIVWDWSPDGSAIAFAAAEGAPGGERSDLAADIVTVAPDGSDVRRLTDTPGPELFPTFSPDGSTIAYVTEDDGVHDIGVMGADGSTPTPLTADDDPSFDDYHPTWSPDGSRIAYVRGHIPNGGPGTLMVVDPEGGAAEVLYDATPVEWPDWSPEGSRIAFDVGAWPNVTVQILDLASGDVTVVGPGYLPRWSPDGSQMLVAIPEGGFGIVDLATSAPMRVLSTSAWAEATWSPDGRWVAFSDRADLPTDAPDTGLIPAVGDAVGGWLEDGTPYLVVRHEDGTLIAVEAISPHVATGGIRKLIGWCPSSRTFDDPFHGSTFDAYGRYLFGPSPTGLRPIPLEPIDADPGVQLGKPSDAVEREVPGDPPAGPRCIDTAETPLTLPTTAALSARDPAAPDTAASLVAWEPEPPLGSRWEIDATLLLRPDGSSFLCDDVVDGECLDGAPVEGPSIDGGDALIVPGRWFVMIRDGSFVDPIRTG